MSEKTLDEISRFRRSSELLRPFLDRWMPKIRTIGQDDTQRRAAYLVWGRYSISIGTLTRICERRYAPDYLLIARSCIEDYATLRAIMQDPTIVQEFFAFHDRSKAYYAKLLEEFDCPDELAVLEPELRDKFGPDWRKESRATWCKASELVKTYAGKDERLLYALFSHFCHSSVVAPLMLDKTHPETINFDTMVAGTYGGYLVVTKEFLDFIWQPVSVCYADTCMKEFNEIMAVWI